MCVCAGQCACLCVCVFVCCVCRYFWFVRVSGCVCVHVRWACVYVNAFVSVRRAHVCVCVFFVWCEGWFVLRGGDCVRVCVCKCVCMRCVYGLWLCGV